MPTPLLSNGSFLQAIKRLARASPRFFYVASFGFRATKDTDQILKMLPKRCDTRFIIGTMEMPPKQRKFLQKYFMNYRFKIVKQCHLKLVVTDKGVILGGRNITNSEWIDLSYLFTNQKLIQDCKTRFLKIYGR